MSIFCFLPEVKILLLMDTHMTCIMHSTDTVFRGNYHKSHHSRALIGLVIQEGVASFMWVVFVCIARYFLSAVS